MKYLSRIDFPALLERVIYSCPLQELFAQFFSDLASLDSVLNYFFYSHGNGSKVQRKQSHGTQKRKYVCVYVAITYYIARHISSKHEIL